MHSITNQLRYGIAIIGLISLFLMGSLVIYYNMQTQLTQLQIIQEARAELVAYQINTYLSQLEHEVSYLSHVHGLTEVSPAMQQSFLKGLVHHNAAYEKLLILDQKGQVQVSFAVSGPTASFDNLTDSTLFSEVFKAEKATVSAVEVDPQTHLPIVILAVPVLNNEDKVGGVLVAQVNLRTLWTIINQIKVGNTGYSYIMDEQHNILAEKNSGTEDFELVNISDRSFLAILMNNASDSLKTYQGLYGDEVFGLMLPISTLNGAVVVELPTAEVYEPIYQQMTAMVAMLLLFTFLTIAMGFRFSRRVVLPLHELNVAASQIRAGQFGVRVAVTSDNEIGMLARTFNQMATQIEELYTTLEQKVATRTRRLELVAMLSERLTAILNFEALLSELVGSIKENFGYYHVHIYLFDEARENLVVAEGTGEPGEIMKRQRHHIAVNQRTSLVARAARTSQIVRVDNVRLSADWLANPLLPQTFSEMAVPIVLDNQVMGVLDVQQDRVGGLDDSDENLLRSLANQVAIALRNARLFNETQQALEDMQVYQERYVQQTWDREKILRRNRGRAQFSLGESTTLHEEAVAYIRQQVVRHKQASLVQIDQPNVDINTVWAAPIHLEQSVIGSLQLYGVEAGHQWSEGELALIKAVIDQVAQSAESLRLVEEVQEQASRQRLISQIGDKLRRAPDMDALMEITVSELSRLLRPARTFVQLDKKE